jgi:uncharacterized protein (TIGR02646 family)
LQQSKERWLQRFLERRAEKPDARPPSRQYGHAEVRRTLAAMSYHKCFYCETRLEAGDEEVDHYVEVAEKPQRAFDWENLYLSCRGCNRRKLDNSAIPVTECVDPCGDDDPTAHLTFEDEIITAKRGSPRGFRTIQKYSLDRQELNYSRVRALQRFENTLRRLHEWRGSRSLTDDEKEIIRRFEQPDHPFSLMFHIYLADVAL